MKRLRFSLMSLLMFSVWAAALVGVYLRRDPWVIDPAIFAEEPEFPGIKRRKRTTEDFDGGHFRIKVHEDGQIYESDRLRQSPDRTRQVMSEIDSSAMVVSSLDGVDKLCEIRLGSLNACEFVDDNTLLVLDFASDAKDVRFRVLHRRYPEWWWGHLYRVEVWLAALIPLFAIGRAIVARRKNRKQPAKAAA